MMSFAPSGQSTSKAPTFCVPEVHLSNSFISSGISLIQRNRSYLCPVAKMPVSPILHTIHPPINNLSVYEFSLKDLRAQWDHDPKSSFEDLTDRALEDGEKLHEHCEFLTAKLDIKVRLWFWRSVLPLSKTAADIWNLSCIEKGI